MSEQTRKEYIARINRVTDHIESHLKEDLCLDTLAKVACFSPFHFHRIFRSITGETLHQHILRIRIQRIAVRLMNDRERTITELAFEYGFSSSAHFSRCFKDFFGTTPTEWKNGKRDPKNSKIPQTSSKQRKADDCKIHYYGFLNHQHKWKIIMKTKDIEITVKDQAAITIAYVRNIGPYKGNSQLFESLFQKLCTWAGPRGLITENTRFFACYHDDPENTEEDKLKLSIGLSVSEDCEVDGEIGKMSIPGGTYGIAYYEVKSPEEFESAWNAIYGQWLPESGYQPGDSICYEEYLNDPKTDPEGIMKINIGIPLKPI